ncbi:MAG: CopG family transcriptional regulator [Rhodocyclaceae bacterium]
MTTTSLKLPDDLKKRAASAAHELGMSPHAFMVSAIEQAAIATEQRLQFVAEARSAREQMIETRKGLDADEVHAYLKAKLAGKKVAKPKTRSWHA